MGREFIVTLGIVGTLSASGTNGTSNKDQPTHPAAQAALRYFESVQDQDVDALLRRLRRPAPVPEVRAIVIRNLPKEGDLSGSTLSTSYQPNQTRSSQRALRVCERGRIRSPKSAGPVHSGSSPADGSATLGTAPVQRSSVHAGAGGTSGVAMRTWLTLPQVHSISSELKCRFANARPDPVFR